MSPAIGQPIRRIEGRAKVVGKARYAAEYPIRNLAHAVPVLSTVPRGRISAIDTTSAQKAMVGSINNRIYLIDLSNITEHCFNHFTHLIAIV